MEPANDQHVQNPDSRSPAVPVRGSARLDSRSGLHFDAAIFDMDGVVTDTATVHFRAWKQMFDDYLRRRSAQLGDRFAEFTRDKDYRAFVDGRPRYEGVNDFLKSRGIRLAWGRSEDTPDTETVCGLGNMKNVIFNQLVERDGVTTFGSTLALIRRLVGEGVRVGLATSSFNSGLVLERSGTASLFETVVDGAKAVRLDLKGKPAPDVFIAATKDLGVPPSRAIVFEDAVTGVQAGAGGGFALVVGIAREGNAAELLGHGADVAVRDLSETSLEEINGLVNDKRMRTG